MSDLVAALGLVLVIEGLLWAAFPSLTTRILQSVVETPEAVLRITGVVVLALGVLIVWLVRG
ncbi:MAG: DUF2065 domain-containing protein [Hyphomicrobium sp.]|uniref:DUF2065 domain-containing protein n=1 Tax=Hyphomicrobium sp. CS1BSMeth3 TaxID=1892844 RepID=UPI000930A98A|nr:DUF2065 domain-containing protein [Hyphomicrobium sp. CS1BSMeth3]MBN9268387.1 DUF2065 domain-containing protein [Hyphomicrobium sp.]MBN9279759.1 DUF2065 domain-containing protein [Hyphomicrobium sp.]OJU26510.1 MAG: hypothetical protein BGN89_00165 [Alphaproteobacteria bacterium 64-6]